MPYWVAMSDWTVTIAHKKENRSRPQRVLVAKKKIIFIPVYQLCQSIPTTYHAMHIVYWSILLYSERMK